MRDRAFSDHGFDWWWHNFYAVNRATGEERPFFIEYFMVNPVIGGAEPILCQLPENKAAGRKPSYAMVMAGTCGEDAMQIKNYYGIDALRASSTELDVAIGANVVKENYLMGSVSVTEEEAESHPEYLSDGGSISWDLTVQKPLFYGL